MDASKAVRMDASTAVQKDASTAAVHVEEQGQGQPSSMCPAALDLAQRSSSSSSSSTVLPVPSSSSSSRSSLPSLPSHPTHASAPAPTPKPLTAKELVRLERKRVAAVLRGMPRPPDPLPPGA